jgi:hypothetical protein
MGQSLSTSGIGETCEVMVTIDYQPPEVAGEASKPVVQPLCH